MSSIQAATSTSRVATGADAPTDIPPASVARIPVSVMWALGALGLLGVLASVLLVSAGAASAPTQFVPARSGGWPAWLAGPWRGLGVGLGSGSFQTLMLIMCASYALVLACARRLPVGALAGAIVLAHAILLLGPPLISQDVFGYLAFARMGALHGLDPYTHFASEAPADRVFPFVGWPFQHSPYGAVRSRSPATPPRRSVSRAGCGRSRRCAALASLAAVALIGRAVWAPGAQRPRWPPSFVGLNPVLLVLAVGGAHNDTLVLALARARAVAYSAAP
jgi:hypothetical protein